MSDSEQITPRSEAAQTTGSQSFDPNSIEGLFLLALQKESPEEREAFVEEVSAGDSERRMRLTALLRAYDDAGSFLETPVGGDRPTLSPTGISLDFLKPTEKPGCIGTLGPYEVIDVIGRGGMGIVLRALDPTLNRVVAVKVLAPELAVNPNARRRFLREAQAAAAVSHPHVVTIHAVDEGASPDNGDRRLVLPYLVMECIVGQSLQQKIDREGSLPLAEILRIGTQIAEGLTAAHRQGLTHRDIKPANILLENGVERVKITDFGLARTQDDVAITRTGEVSGTPQYMSPEQATGERVDQRSDLFSLGCLLYAMATGHSPFRGDSLAHVIKRVTQDTPRPINEQNPEVPIWLVETIHQLLEKDPDRRPQSAEEVSRRLEGQLANVQQGVRRTVSSAANPSVNSVAEQSTAAAPAVRPKKASTRHWFRPWMVVALLLVIAAAIVSLAMEGRPENVVVEVAIVGLLALAVFAVPILILSLLIRRSNADAGSDGGSVALAAKILLWMLIGATFVFSVAIGLALWSPLLDQPERREVTVDTPRSIQNGSRILSDAESGDGAGGLITGAKSGPMFGAGMGTAMDMGSMGEASDVATPNSDDQELPPAYVDGLPSGTTWTFNPGAAGQKVVVSVRILSPGMLVALRRKSVFDGSISDDETLITLWGHTLVNDLVPGEYEVLVRDEKFGWKVDRKGSMTIRQPGHGILDVRRDIAGVIHPDLRTGRFRWNGQTHELNLEQLSVITQLAIGLASGDAEVAPSRVSRWNSGNGLIGFSGGFGGGGAFGDSSVDVESLFFSGADGYTTEPDGPILFTRGETKGTYRLSSPDVASVRFQSIAPGLRLTSFMRLDPETGEPAESFDLQQQWTGPIAELDLSPGNYRMTYEDSKIRFARAGSAYITMIGGLGLNTEITVAKGQQYVVELRRDWNQIADALDATIAGGFSLETPTEDDLFRLSWFNDTPGFHPPSSEFTLKRRQLPILSMLFHAFAEGRDVEDGPDNVVSSVFTETEKEHWNGLIVPGATEGTWRLNVPEEYLTPETTTDDSEPDAQ